MSARHRKQLDRCMALLDEAESANDTRVFQQVLDRGGVAILAELRKSDFDYPRFHRWRKHNKPKKMLWFVVYSATMCCQPVHELKLANEALNLNPDATMKRFNSRPLSDKFVSEHATSTSTYHVAVFGGYLILCTTPSDTRDQGAHDMVPFSSKKQAQQFIDAGQEWWVVWASTSTGVITEDRCVDATCDFHAS